MCLCALPTGAIPSGNQKGETKWVVDPPSKATKVNAYTKLAKSSIVFVFPFRVSWIFQLNEKHVSNANQSLQGPSTVENAKQACIRCDYMFGMSLMCLL